MKKKYLAFFDSTYSLFIFLLVNTEKIEKTLFLFSDGIPDDVRKKTNNIYQKYPVKNINKNIQKLLFIHFHLKTRLIIKKIFKKNKLESFYGQDHTFWGNHILNYKKNIIVFEDGFSNYTLPKKRKNRFVKIKKLIKIELFSPYGVNDKVSKIYLTGLMPIPEIIKDKVEIIDLQKLWNDKSFEEQEMILNIFNLSISKMENMARKKVILLTQTLSEDHLMSEEEKIKLYKEMLEPYENAEVLIKPHPREKTDYTKYFPQYEVVSEQFPVQLFKLNNIYFEEVVTVFSTAANDFLGEETKLVFKGTKFNNKLYELVGNIFYDEHSKQITVEKHEEK